MKEILTTKKLKFLQKDEHEASIEYDEISKQMALKGHTDISQIFAQMASDEKRHEQNIIMLLKRKEIKINFKKIFKI